MKSELIFVNGEKQSPDFGYSQEMTESMLINLANKRAYEMLQQPDPPPSIVLHFLKIGSMKEQEGLALTRASTRLAEARVEDIQRNADLGQMYADAMKALTDYSNERENNSKVL